MTDVVDAHKRTVFRTCPLCEATCGLELTVSERPGETPVVIRIRGDRDDVFSKGFICPKGSTLTHIHDDPDRLRRPVVKRNGEFVEVSWDEAFAEIEERMLPILKQHGRDSAAIYNGNPGAHNIAPMLFNRNLISALGSRNRFSASTVDQRPKEITSSLMFGSVAVPVPDLDRTMYVMLLGANPHASNGSLCTAPDFPGRLDRLQERGGRVVVVDPRRSETAERADEHVAIRPATDAHLLAGIAHVLLAERLAKPDNVAAHCNGLDRLPELLAPYTPDAVASVCGVPADTVRRLARDLAAAPCAAVYGRIGTCTQEFGTLASWLVDVVNILTGNLDRVGGAMFSKGAVGQPSTKGKPGSGKGFRMGRQISRAGKHPEALGEFPVTALPEEIETPGDGQVRVLVTNGGNPVSSNANSNRLSKAFEQLEFMVSIDPYINETTRHADVILPPPSALQKSHYDLALYNFAVHNVANYSPAVLPLETYGDGERQPDEWEIILRLAALLEGEGPDADPREYVRKGARAMLEAAARDEWGSVHGRNVDEMEAMLGDETGPERMLDVMLRTGPYGDAFGSRPDGLSLAVLRSNPHGVDLGALEPDRIPNVLRTPSGRIEVAPDMIVADLARLGASLQRDWDASLVLVGRRHVRSNNSWMHNIRVLTKGRNRCTMQIHPDDAVRLGITDGAPAKVASRTGEVVVTAEVTDVIRPGVVSIPHGFGQDLPGVRLRVASEYRGVNTNVLTDEYFVDPLSGNIALNGVPVSVQPA